jgi:hypothetical protein
MRLGPQYLSARVSAIGFLEHRIEYDWTVRKFVSEIMDEHMVAEGSTTHTVIRPGEVKWIGYYVDPERTIASETTRSGVRGEVCITNANTRALERMKVIVQLQSQSDGTWRDVPGTTTAISTDVELGGEATRCFSYEIAHTQPGPTLRVIGGAVSGVHAFTYATMEFAPAEHAITVEIDAEAFARDEVFEACDRTLGSKFHCASVFELPRTWHFTETSDGHWETFPPGDYYTYYVLDISNQGECGKTFTYKNVAQLWESGPKPPGGEAHEAEATLTFTTGECKGGRGCTRTIGYWKNHAGGEKKTNVVSRLLPVWLGSPNGTNSVLVTTTAQAREILAKSGDASNGINKLMAQLLAAKLNIQRGADASIVSAIIAVADAFLARTPASDWTILPERSPVPAVDRRSVLNWATFLDEFNNGKVGPGSCDEDDDHDDDDDPEGNDGGD